MRTILIVGAGLAGAVHARTLAEAGCDVLVVERRDHIAGNAYDEVVASGVRVHRYGPHLFHTSNQSVLAWIKRHGDWMDHTHKVRTQLPSGQAVPIPINVETINVIFGTAHRTAVDAQAHVDRLVVPIEHPRNAAEFLAARIGIELRDLLFRPYTRKMWARDLEDLSPKVVARLPLHVREHDTYFNDSDTQLLPIGGYTAFVGRILDHPRIKLQLRTPFDPCMLEGVEHCFASMPIDEYFGFSLGRLPYRSLRFAYRDEPAAAVTGAWAGGGDFVSLHFADDGPVTRETAWHRLPGHIVRSTGSITLTRETPCDDVENGMERYYPILASDGSIQARYEAYRALAENEASITFIGRCGLYRYLDMDQVISQSLASAQRWLVS